MHLLPALEMVGGVTQEVPVRPANRAQVFPFTYTFTSQDATVGKVNFKAIATVINACDAFSAENERISFVTIVAR